MHSIKVLWFSFAQPVAVLKKLGLPVKFYKGWVESLKEAIEKYEPGWHIYIASAGHIAYTDFTEGTVTYCHIPSLEKSSFGIKRILNRWSLDSHDSHYLRVAGELVNRISPDLIHVHGSENPFGLLCNMTSIPLIISLQGILNTILWYEETGYTFQQRLQDIVSVKFIKGMSIYHSLRKLKVMTQRERIILRSCKYLSGRTDWDKNVSHFINTDARYYHCDEILRSPFYRANMDFNKVIRNRLFTITNPSPRKGLLFLLKAVDLLTSMNRKDISLRIAGELDDSSYKYSISDYITKNNLEDKVVFLGKLNAKDLVHEMERASIFIHPSLIDNSPNSLAEAMLCGVPCIASRVGGIPSMLRDGEDGLLYNSTDHFELAHSISYLMENRDIAISLSNSARKQAMVRHNRQRVASEMTSIYKHILESELQSNE